MAIEMGAARARLVRLPATNPGGCARCGHTNAELTVAFCVCGPCWVSSGGQFVRSTAAIEAGVDFLQEGDIVVFDGSFETRIAAGMGPDCPAPERAAALLLVGVWHPDIPSLDVDRLSKIAHKIKDTPIPVAFWAR